MQEKPLAALLPAITRHGFCSALPTLQGRSRPHTQIPRLLHVVRFATRPQTTQKSFTFIINHVRSVLGSR